MSEEQEIDRLEKMALDKVLDEMFEDDECLDFFRKAVGEPLFNSRDDAAAAFTKLSEAEYAATAAELDQSWQQMQKDQQLCADDHERRIVLARWCRENITSRMHPDDAERYMSSLGDLVEDRTDDEGHTDDAYRKTWTLRELINDIKLTEDPAVVAVMRARIDQYVAGLRELAESPHWPTHIAAAIRARADKIAKEIDA